MKIDIFVTESEMEALKAYLEYKHEMLKNNYGYCTKCPDHIHDITRCKKFKICDAYNYAAEKESKLYEKAAIMINNPAFTDLIKAYKELLKAKEELKKAQNAADFCIQNYVNAMANVNIVEDEEDERRLTPMGN